MKRMRRAKADRVRTEEKDRKKDWEKDVEKERYVDREKGRKQNSGFNRSKNDICIMRFIEIVLYRVLVKGDREWGIWINLLTIF